MGFLRTFESNKFEHTLASSGQTTSTHGGGIGSRYCGGGIGSWYCVGGIVSYVFVVDHLHEPKFSERPFCICLILKWLYKLLDCHLLPSFCVQSRAGGRREQRDEDTGHY